ncbi:hypothetical protein SASPL_113580 [Salvia splendens]|uniref:Phosphoglycerate mutase n=1 Tax=Salvia splendens TaxID=180675 RepID=A0A8X8ZZM3_SALSN|nr:hypothetical protein SASPL_113580 [Salvia splendens]
MLDSNCDDHHHQSKQRERILPKRIILIRHGESADNIDGAAYATTPTTASPSLPRATSSPSAPALRSTTSYPPSAESAGHFRGAESSAPGRNVGSESRISAIFRLLNGCVATLIDEQSSRSRSVSLRFWMNSYQIMNMCPYTEIAVCFLESLWRDIDMSRLHHDPTDELNLVMQLGEGGEYSLAVQHSEEQMQEWGLSPDMIADQQWLAQANKGNWTDSCPWYPNSSFAKFADPETEGTGDELQSPPYIDCSNDS